MAIRKNKLYYLGLIGIIFTGSACSAQNSIEIRNRVSACLEMRPLDRSLSGTLPIITVDVSVKKNAGECGCMSAALIYRVSLGAPPQSFQLIDGVLGTLSLKSGKIQLPLALTSDLVDGKDLEMIFSCKPPA